jgi:hypothetical protein
METCSLSFLCAFVETGRLVVRSKLSRWTLEESYIPVFAHLLSTIGVKR